MNKFILVSAFMASFLALSIEATAQPGFCDRSGEGLNVNRLARHLDLTDEQREQIAGVINSAKLESAVDRERQRQLMEELQLQAENFDTGTTQNLADELGQVMSRLTYSRIYTMSQVRAVLTEEQLARMGERRGGGSKGFRGKRGGDEGFLIEE